MKQLIKTSRAAGQLEKMFRTLSADLFGGELEEPIITIQSSPKTHGHVTSWKVWRRKGGSSYELNIAAETLDRPIENVVCTMIHEMCHLLNLKNNVQDTSRNGTYHNKVFKDTAEAHLLEVYQIPKYGWAITKPSEKLLEYVLERGWTEIEIGRAKDGMDSIDKDNGGNQSGGNGGSKAGTKTSSTRKYYCPKCRQSIRATKAVNIICGDCMIQMITDVVSALSNSPQENDREAS